MPAHQRLLHTLAQLGPGIAIAATGVGAADLVTASVAGSKYGNVLLWAAVVGAVLKYVLNEGVARWQLATGLTVFEGWARHLGRPVTYFFLGYLLLWAFFVSGGLIVAVGLAAHSLFPAVSTQWWSVAQALLAYVLVLLGSYARFETLMKLLVAAMFVAIVGCTFASGISPSSLAVAPRIPPGSLAFTLGLIGGVGGSVTMLAYGYWIQEKEWSEIGWLKTVRLDLALGYGLTGLFAIGVMMLSTEVLYKQQIEVQGQQGVIQMAGILESSLGPAGQWIFLIGFWGAVFSSILGVFQGVPYLFCDFVFCLSGKPAKLRETHVHPQSRSYRVFLTYMVFPSMLLLFVQRPVWVIVGYAAISSLFLPFLALTLLYLNNRGDFVGERNRNGFLTNAILVAAVLLFAYLGFRSLGG